MAKLILALFATFVLLTKNGIHGSAIGTRIVGGETAEIGEFPWQASLRAIGGSHFCGSTIISLQHLLTAAHCVAERVANDFVAVTGTNSLISGGQINYIRTIHVHANYVRPVLGYHIADVAVLVLQAAIVESPLQRPIALAIEDVPNDVPAVMSGWGSTETDILSPQLQKLNVTVMNSTECQARWGDTVVMEDNRCTLQPENSGICMADSGGGLIYNNQVVGFLTWANPCGRGYPDVYTNVYYYLFWIGSRVYNSETEIDTTTPDNGQFSLIYGNNVALILSMSAVVHYLLKK